MASAAKVSVAKASVARASVANRVRLVRTVKPVKLVRAVLLLLVATTRLEEVLLLAPPLPPLLLPLPLLAPLLLLPAARVVTPRLPRVSEYPLAQNLILIGCDQLSTPPLSLLASLRTVKLSRRLVRSLL